MPYNEEIFRELYQLRQQIKDRGRRIQGKTPLVCTDDALRSITELCPKKISDFDGIPGVGKTFVEKYGEQFLQVILKYAETPNEKTVHMTKAASDILKELEKKLVSINSRNRLLYLPRLAAKYGFDLTAASKECTEKIIFGGGRPVTICNMKQNSRQEENNYRKIVQLLREVNKDLREKGQNDLYVGYPFVIGRLQGENFNVRAPLALFPVAAERTPNEIGLSLDESRDAIFNIPLVLAFFKFNNILKPLPSDVLENDAKASFESDILSFYAEQGIEIAGKLQEISSFQEYTADSFPRYHSGHLELESCAVLGKFPVRDSSIQKDFDEILKSGEINGLLSDLLLGADEVDYYSDAYTGEKPVKESGRELEISEHDLTYINSLNSSQEAVLAGAQSLDELVVQGPPGTGKSQTITSLISQFVNQGKTVLMVSEKKTALDVVYSRLGELSRYALLIDDVGNKDGFYRQLAKMVSFGRPAGHGDFVLSGMSDKIDSLIWRLRTIADRLFAVGNFGIEPYKLYLQNKKIDFTDEAERTKAQNIHQKRSAALMDFKYPELNRIYQLFRDAFMLGYLARFCFLCEQYPWLGQARGNLSEYDLLECRSQLSGIEKAVQDWRSKNFVARLFSKGKIARQIRTNLRQHFDIVEKRLENLVFDNAALALEGMEHYRQYQELKPLYDRLRPEEREYLSSMLAIREDGPASLEAANEALFQELLYEHITQFEMENRELFQEINCFDSIIRELGDTMEKKRRITRRQLESMLAKEMYNIATSKRHGEILRVLESKRKWSVNKFIKKFDFELFKSVKIWLLTPEVVSEIIPLQTGIFDLVVFDEASQMYVEKGIPSILRAKKVVIAGDHKQLRPSSLGRGRVEVDLEELPEDAEVAAPLEEESLLDLARFKYQDVLLNFHYRSKYEELIAFSNYAFYGGRLYVSPNFESSPLPPIQFHTMEDALWVNRSNRAEAQYIVAMLRQFFADRTGSETIGIITFNVGQRDLIDDLIDEECAKDPEFGTMVRTEIARRKDGEDIGLFVKNIESVQGDERDVIIFSIGYAKNENGRLVRNFGWLNQRGGENRLNVAISRAKEKVHIVASFHPSNLQVEDMKHDGPRFLKKYLEYAFAVSNGDKAGARDVLMSFGDAGNPGEVVSFDSEFENQVYDALVQKGYRVDTQVGIGGYSIDLAIKKDGKYVLGIECDGRLYHSSKSARERDYHRQKYLESRGWRIHRIWSTNWWKNPGQEIAKICALAETL